MDKIRNTSLRYLKNVSDNLESSHNKVLSRIQENAKVLEVGPASGAMTKILKNSLNCQVSVIEYDKECYEIVKEYADVSICENIENDEWVSQLSGQVFDYIIFADVLEHLLNPQKVLEKMRQFLTEEGSILVSIPNVAHNSIIIQLLNNNLFYQNTGLLDYSHVKFYTYNQAMKLFEDAEYYAVYIDATYVAVGKNEFDIHYSDTDPIISEYLKRRPLGEVYQYLFELKKKSKDNVQKYLVENYLGNVIGYDDSKIICYKDTDEIVPNELFATNKEIARMRLEINDLYNSIPELGNTLTLRHMIEQLQEEVHEKNNHIRNLLLEISEKDKVILECKQMYTQEQMDELKKQISEMYTQEQMNELKKQISEMYTQEQMNELKKQMSEMYTQEQMNELKKQISEMYTQEQMDELKKQMSEMYTQEQMDDLKQIIRNKEGHIELLLETERAWEREKQTLSYRIMVKERKIWDFFFPPVSKRRFFVEVMAKMLRHPILMYHVINPTRIKNFFIVLKKYGAKGIFEWYDNAIEIENKKINPATTLQINNQIVKDVKVVNSELNVESLEKYDKLIFTYWNQPEVSIVIPVYNQFEYTYNCLKSIMNNSGDVKYEIIIANDCSTDNTSNIERIVQNIRLITTEKNVRFLLNCNNAARYARGKYVLFLNNDTQVQENWLRPLIDLIEQDSTIGMVGSMLIYPDGKLQEAGGIVWKDASAWNYGNRKNPDDAEFNYVKEADYISGAAIMIKKSLWETIGGFDEQFAPAYYEDTDLAFEVRRHGYKVMYQPLSKVVHFEGVSNGTDVQTGLKHYQQVNYEKFYKKWRDVLEAEHEVNAENVFKAKDRSNHKKHILVVDHYVPHHDQDAGGKCTYMYLQTFVKMGFKVTFIGDNFYKHEPYTTELNQMGIEVLYGNYYYNNWENWLKENAHYFDYIYLQRPHISIKYIDLVKEYSNAKILYFAHDLHHIREYREYEMTGDIEKLESSKRWKKIEYELFEKADVGHVVGSFEQQKMQAVFPQKPIRNIPLYIYESLLNDINKDFSTRNDLLYVGGFGHSPNIDAVLWFAREIFPHILEKFPDVKWHVVGSKAPKEILELASDNIIIEGFLSDEDLDKLYRTCRIAVVPLRYGAGVKGKVVESAYYQIPLVTTSIGAEGLSREEGFMTVEDDSIDLATTICDLYEDFVQLRNMSDSGKIFINNYFTLAEAERVLRLDID